MVMEKHGVRPEIEHQGLREEEAQLMSQIAAVMSNPEELAKIENKLHQIRAQLTRLDLKETLVEDT